MSRSRYLIGIDLGTTNCALAYVDSKGRDRPSADIKVFEVPQLVAPGEVATRSMLPSFLYLPGEHELAPGSTSLPWRPGADRVVGEFARVQGASVPGRLVTSAKSWLCHAGVDREADILPWAGAPEVKRVSPVEASADYLSHLRDSWNHVFASKDTASRMEEQEIVLTVPASFDEAARELTLESAKRAGIASHLTLLEEPQAAFYCWIVTHHDRWRNEIRAGERILVCDIGGGTTDFSLISVIETADGPGFRRVAVGDHLMLGGDNMDLALAHQVERKLENQRLDARQWSALAQACRNAKEKLLADDPPARWPVTIAGRGSKLIGGSIQAELTQKEVLHGILDGFFPITRAEEEPAKGAKAGLQEFGLPFVADPAIPRHLASFLRRHATEIEGKPSDRPIRPDAILFNGGALNPKILRDRIVEVVAAWSDAYPGTTRHQPIRVLSNESLDLAVAIGAAYYGIVRRGGGIRIGGGIARSLYVGFESEDRAKPWLCVIPRDAQEGDEIAIERHDFDLLMGQPVSFPLAGSSVRPQDRQGDLVAADPESIRDLPPLHTIMKVGRKAKAERVAVRLAARVSEVGTIDLWCQSRSDDRRWRLQIQLRGPSGHGDSHQASVLATTLDATDRGVLEESILANGIAAIRSAFVLTANDQNGPARLIKTLEDVLELERRQWPPSALRAFWEPLRDVAELRRKSPRHESRWLNLAGYCLRPGTGFPLDETRIKMLWPLFHQGLHHVKDPQCWADWWVLWRRVAAGLARAHHDEIHRRIVGLLPTGKGSSAAKKQGRPKPEPHELAEIWRCVAAMERLNAQAKESLGHILVKEIARQPVPGYALWSMGRLGSRVPLYGPANTVVSANIATGWIEQILTREFSSGRETTDAIFALGQLARVSGDRARDVEPELRDQVIQKLESMNAGEALILPIRAYHSLAVETQDQALGDSLPVGLRLVRVADDAQS